LPDLQDVKDGIIAAKIAAHAADIAKGLPGARDIDNKMSDARRRVDWEEMFTHAIDPIKARGYHESAPKAEEKCCSMCGKMCAVRTMNKILEGEDLGL
jgi:phosphomethylpyrimidine synthase